MDILSAVILGIVEGVTEFLPVSSTGHMILTGKLLGLPDIDFLKSFEIVVQLGAILAVVALYARSLLVKPMVLLKVAVAFLPTAVIGFFSYKILKSFLLGSTQVVLWSLLLGGVFLIIFELLYKKPKNEGNIDQVTVRQAFVIGAFQSLAIIPGVSRSAATIIGGLFLGLGRTTAAEFSFLLAIPTMGAAVALDLSKNAMVFTWNDIVALTVGFFVSFVVAILVIKVFMRYLQQNNFISFGIYRVVLALVLLFIWQV